MVPLSPPKNALALDPATNTHQDYEWAQDWLLVRDVFADIADLKRVFKALDTPYLHQLHAKQLVLHLQKYAWSLQHWLVEKYRDRTA